MFKTKKNTMQTLWRALWLLPKHIDRYIPNSYYSKKLVGGVEDCEEEMLIPHSVYWAYICPLKIVRLVG